MFKTLKIKNFKSHKDTQIDFHEGVNVIIGDPLSGKTNIIRASLLLAKNRPLGADFFSHFAGDKGTTKVSLSLSDAPTVELRKHIEVDEEGKHPGDAEYLLGDKGYKGFGANVPDTIVNALNLSDLNIQKQLDTPFLITSSPGEVARTINRITKLEQVDGWVSELTSRINKTNVEIRIIEDQKKEVESELERYSDIDEVEKIIEDLDKVYKEEKELQRQQTTLDRYLVDMEGIKKELRELTSFLSAEKYMLKAETIGNQMENLVEEQDLLTNVIEVAEDIKELEGYLIVEKEVEKAEKFTGEIQQLILEEGLMQGIVDLDRDISGLEEEREALRNRYVVKLKEFGKCPTCFSVIDGDRIQSIVKEI